MMLVVGAVSLHPTFGNHIWAYIFIAVEAQPYTWQNPCESVWGLIHVFCYVLDLFYFFKENLMSATQRGSLSLLLVAI